MPDYACPCDRCQAEECWPCVPYEVLNAAVDSVVAQRSACCATPQMRWALAEIEKCLALLHAHRETDIACRVQQAYEILAVALLKEN